LTPADGTAIAASGALASADQVTSSVELSASATPPASTLADVSGAAVAAPDALPGAGETVQAIASSDPGASVAAPPAAGGMLVLPPMDTAPAPGQAITPPATEQQQPVRMVSQPVVQGESAAQPG